MINNQILLKQARKSVKELIKESLERIIIYRKPLIDDGSGNGVMVEDPYGDPEEFEIKCRISHERRQPSKLEDSAAGMSTNLQRFILVDWETNIYENDYFESNDINKAFKIGPVDPLIKFGGITGYQAPLVEGEELSDDT